MLDNLTVQIVRQRLPTHNITPLRMFATAILTHSHIANSEYELNHRVQISVFVQREIVRKAELGVLSLICQFSTNSHRTTWAPSTSEKQNMQHAWRQ
jgi:hypothetical protein